MDGENDPFRDFGSHDFSKSKNKPKNSSGVQQEESKEEIFLDDTTTHEQQEKQIRLDRDEQQQLQHFLQGGADWQAPFQKELGGGIGNLGSGVNPFGFGLGGQNDNAQNDSEKYEATGSEIDEGASEEESNQVIQSEVPKPPSSFLPKQVPTYINPNKSQIIKSQQNKYKKRGRKPLYIKNIPKSAQRQQLKQNELKQLSFQRKTLYSLSHLQLEKLLKQKKIYKIRDIHQEQKDRLKAAQCKQQLQFQQIRQHPINNQYNNNQVRGQRQANQSKCLYGSDQYLTIYNTQNKKIRFSDLLLPFQHKIKKIFNRNLYEKETYIGVQSMPKQSFLNFKDQNQAIFSDAQNLMSKDKEIQEQLQEQNEQKNMIKNIKQEDNQKDQKGQKMIIEKPCIFQNQVLKEFKNKLKNIQKVNILNSGYFYDQLKQISYQNLEKNYDNQSKKSTQILKKRRATNSLEYTDTKREKSNDFLASSFRKMNRFESMESPFSFAGGDSIRQENFNFSTIRDTISISRQKSTESNQKNQRIRIQGNNSNLFDPKDSKEDEVIMKFTKQIQNNKFFGGHKVQLKNTLKEKADNFYQNVHDKIFKITEIQNKKHPQQKEVEDPLNKQPRNFLYYNQDIISGNWKKNFLEEFEKDKAPSSPPLFIDLNDQSLFYEAIHRSCKTEEKNQDVISIDKRLNNFLLEKQQLAMNNLEDNNKWKLQFERSQQVQTIQHTKPATQFQFIEFDSNKQDFKNFHRHDIFPKRKDYNKQKKSGISKNIWKVNIIKDSKVLPGIGESYEKRDSYQHFKNLDKLSLKGGDFFLLEFIEEYPLVITTFGMASKLVKYVYHKRAKAQMKSNNDLSQIDERLNLSQLGSQSKTDFKSRSQFNETESLRSKSQMDKSENKSQTASFTTKLNINNQQKSKEELKIKQKITEMLGPHGNIRFLKPTDSIPLLGQLTDVKYCGVFLMRNNLYMVPIFKQKVPETDFILVTRTITRQPPVQQFGQNRQPQIEKKYFLRKIQYVYVAGQIEPRMEVYSPSSRTLNNLIKRILRFYIHLQFQNCKQVVVPSLFSMFKTLNDTIIRKHIRALGGEQKQSNSKVFVYNKNNMPIDQERKNKIQQSLKVSPEEIVLFESMLASLSRIKSFGIEDQRSTDKINTAFKRYQREHQENNSEQVKISKLIAEELQLTTWNLSQSFITAKQTQGRLYLEGLGDPTNGHGGISYVKKRLKISRYDKNFQQVENNENGKSGIAKNNQITLSGSEADLRKLKLTKVDGYLRKYGENPKHYKKRWDKIQKLREIAILEVSKNEKSELAIFARQDRVTAKKAKQIYQKQINKKLSQMIQTLSKMGTDGIESDESQGPLVDQIECEEYEDPFINNQPINQPLQLEDQNSTIISFSFPFFKKQ